MMEVAMAVARRSRDETQRVGAVVCTAGWRILGTGYNGPPAGSPDTLPMGGGMRHLWVIHAEENALLQAVAADGWPLQGARAFVTHRPCSRCVARLYHAGVASATYMEDSLREDQRREVEAVEAVLSMQVEQVRWE